MSKSAENVYLELDKYITFMKSHGKNPTALYVTRKQYKTVNDSLNDGLFKEDWKDYKGYEIKIHE